MNCNTTHYRANSSSVPGDPTLERYRLAVEPYLTPLLALVSIVLGVFAGLSAAGRWQTWLLWRNRTDFGVKDPQFGKDASYYVMTYPMLRFVLGFLLATLVLALIAAAATHYLFGGLRLQTVGEKVSPAARAHLSVLLGVIVLCKAAAYYLDRFGLVFSTRGFVQGAGYTDVNAVLPGKNILIGVAVICSLLFFANVRVRNVLLPGGALGLLVIAAVLLGGIIPAFTQSARVKPNEVARETPYIQRNIDATRAAYGITDDKVKVTDYAGSTTSSSTQLESATQKLPNARLLDPNVLPPTFEQLQRQRAYFGVDDLDVDRYSLPDPKTGKPTTGDYVVAAREVEQGNLTGSQRNWINQHLAYTHGNGFIAAPSSTVNGQGEPVFAVGNVPVSGATPDSPSPISIDEPRVYFGEKSPNYSVVNTTQGEIDGPETDNTQTTVNYKGDGGVQLSGLGRKIAYALKFREPNLLLSGAIKKDSRILYDREPRERVKKVAPFLEVDGNPYPAVVDGKLLWIVDAYTTTSRYPYSQQRGFGEITTDSRTGQIQPQKSVNYIRNSVKATVDAYTGKVTLYEFGDQPDPLLKAWDKAFGGIVRPQSEISPGLRAHLRYPEDLFKVQRELLTQYHVTTPAGFFSREDFWTVPGDPANAVNRAANAVSSGAGATNATAQASAAADVQSAAAEGPAQPPYYSLLQYPGQATRFQLSTSFTALNRPNLAAFASVSSDPDDYGVIRILKLDTNDVPGPGQVANQFLANSDVASKLFALRQQGGTRLTFGNLITLPVGDGLLYVQPVFVQGQGNDSFPLLQQVVVSFGTRTASEKTLAAALTSLFSQPEGGTPAVTPTTPTTGPTPSGGPSPSATPSATAPPSSDLAALVQQANTAFLAGEAALRRSPPDYTEYGRQQTLLKAALNRLAQLQAPASTPSPAPTPTPSR